MNRLPKLVNFLSHATSKTQPLTLKEVLQLRDGREINRTLHSTVSQGINFSAMLQNINHLNSLN